MQQRRELLPTHWTEEVRSQHSRRTGEPTEVRRQRCAAGGSFLRLPYCGQRPLGKAHAGSPDLEKGHLPPADGAVRSPPVDAPQKQFSLDPERRVRKVTARLRHASSGVAPGLSSHHFPGFPGAGNLESRSFRRDAENHTPEAYAPQSLPIFRRSTLEFGLRRVGGADGLKRHKANDRLAPPLIKPDGRFSRIRLCGGHSLASLLRQRLFPRRRRRQPIQAIISSRPTHAEPKALEPFLPHLQQPGFLFGEHQAVRFQPAFEPRQQLRPLPRSGQDRRDNREPATVDGCTCVFAARAARYLRGTQTRNSANTGRHLVKVIAFEK